MPYRAIAHGKSELLAERRRQRALLLSAAVFSAFVNVLMMTGPLFMLQVYDRVLAARAEETLLTLFVLVVFLFAVMGILDFVRGQLMARVAGRMFSRLEARVFGAVLRRNAMRPEDPISNLGLADLDALQRLLASRILLALFDMPWSPLFFLAIFLFHPLLGWLAVAGGAILIGVTLLNRATTRTLTVEASQAQSQAQGIARYMRDEADTLQALGMQRAMFERWHHARGLATYAEARANDRSNGFSSFARTFRQLLQSAMLALGAFIVLRGEMSAGAMIAGSILMGRALSPIETVIGGWSLVARARDGWTRLPDLLEQLPAASDKPVARPQARLRAQDLTVIPPGASAPSLRMVSFRLEPGQALGIIGPSGCGKTTLARALCGICPVAHGTIRIDGTAPDHFGTDTLGQLIGYLPQRVSLFTGTVAENIARMARAPSLEAVIDAAKRADAHDMIMDLPDGYHTQITSTQGRLSGGQLQRIGLARALFGDPVVLILDEPNSNLDADGNLALNKAIRRQKEAQGAVIVMAHRPAAIAECDQLIMLERGVVRAYGPRDQVLAETVRNAAQLGKVMHIDGKPDKRAAS
ncbi:type I secretion system permease/ATPase [Rhodobacteraceae bacterium]|nr:type I secretion system permease/ATPase [Paracoccaceae bacterium]